MSKINNKGIETIGEGNQSSCHSSNLSFKERKTLVPYVGENEMVSNSCLNPDSASKFNETKNKRSSVGFEKDLSSARPISIHDETRTSS